MVLEKDKLLDLEAEIAQHAQQASRAAHGDFVVLRTRLAEEIVVGSEMNYRSDVVPMVLTQNAESFPARSRPR